MPENVDPAADGHAGPGSRMNARQAGLVAAFLERGRLSPSDCEQLLPEVARRTVQRELKALVEAGLVVERGAGPTDPTRHFRWAGPAD